MLKDSKIKFNNILSNQTENIEMNTNYLAVAKVIASKLKSEGRLTPTSSEAMILTVTNEYVDYVGNVAIIDRGRFKSILNKTLKDSVSMTNLRKSSTVAELFNIDIGEVDYNKNIGELISLTVVLFFSGE